MVLPMLAAVALGLVWLLTVGAAQLRTVDAARETARAVARGDDTAAAVGRGEEVGPPGTRVRVSAGDTDVVATATAPVSGPGGLFGWMPGITLHARAVATTEETS